MLKYIDPLLSPDLLLVLAAMGHGDELVIVDANFPAVSTAQRLIRLDGVSATRTLQAVLSLFPLDDFVDSPTAVMQVVNAPEMVPEIVQEFKHIVNAAEGRDVKCTAVERLEFYERTRGAFAVIVTGETRLYGNIILKKGIIRPASVH
jgi:L-fucose mutarotase